MRYLTEVGMPKVSERPCGGVGEGENPEENEPFPYGLGFGPVSDRHSDGNLARDFDTGEVLHVSSTGKTTPIPWLEASRLDPRAEHLADLAWVVDLEPRDYGLPYLGDDDTDDDSGDDLSWSEWEREWVADRRREELFKNFRFLFSSNLALLSVHALAFRIAPGLKTAPMLPQLVGWILLLVCLPLVLAAAGVTIIRLTRRWRSGSHANDDFLTELLDCLHGAYYGIAFASLVALVLINVGVLILSITWGNP